MFLFRGLLGLLRASGSSNPSLGRPKGGILIRLSLLGNVADRNIISMYDSSMAFKGFCHCSKTKKLPTSGVSVDLRPNLIGLVDSKPRQHNRPARNFSSKAEIINTEHRLKSCSSTIKSSSWSRQCLNLRLGLGQYKGNLDYLQTRSSSSSTTSKCDEIYDEVASLIRSKATNILIMAGAGISTPSGIPDFRSPGTGLYDNLQKYNLPYPEAIFDIHYFMMDPRPFIALAQDLYPGVNYQPNFVHYFMRLLHENQKLQKVYTQNIDGLERIAGIPEEKLMEAHGTFASASCTLCGKMHPSEKVKDAILSGEVPKCEGTKCKGKVKPDIVFFGENLPERFWDYHTETHFSDLLLVIGTSLEVYPFAGIAESVNRQTPRVLINREPVGSFGTRSNDYMLLGDLEDSVKRLAKAIGWERKLEDLVQNS